MYMKHLALYLEQRSSYHYNLDRVTEAKAKCTRWDGGVGVWPHLLPAPNWKKNMAPAPSKSTLLMALPDAE